MFLINTKNLVIPCAGGYGKVYAGMLNGVQPVAIKVTTSSSPEQQRRFLQEIALLKACRDVNIVLFLGACVLGQKTLMVMEWMAGGNLFDKLAGDQARELVWHKRSSPTLLEPSLIAPTTSLQMAIPCTVETIT